MNARVLLVCMAALAFTACGYKGPLVQGDPAAADGAQKVETSKAPDAESAALPASRDADAVIDEAQDADPPDGDG